MEKIEENFQLSESTRARKHNVAHVANDCTFPMGLHSSPITPSCWASKLKLSMSYLVGLPTTLPQTSMSYLVVHETTLPQACCRGNDPPLQDRVFTTMAMILLVWGIIFFTCTLASTS